MIRSISHRIYLGFLLSGIVYTTCIVFIADRMDDDIEQAMLSAGMAQQQAFYAGKIDGGFQTWETADTLAAFIPEATLSNHHLPQVFQGIKSPFQDEVELPDGRTFLISAKQYSKGTLYVGRDISLYEQREFAHRPAFAMFAVFIIMLVVMLSWQLSRRLSLPLVSLTKNIRQLEPASENNRLTEDFEEHELKAIVTTMNRFLDALEAHTNRERSLINMISHELRTPAAVILGAVEIIDKRNQLAANDRKTLDRIKQTCNEMQANTEALLLLARHSAASGNAKELPVIETIFRVKAELEQARDDAAQRITISGIGKAARHMADTALSHMLFRNLLDNALRHTDGLVRISFTDESLLLEDEGPGIVSISRQQSHSVQAGITPTGEHAGLGLTIVSMIVENLRWKVNIVNPAGTGNRIVIVFNT